MPELPEVETIVRELRRSLTGATIASAQVFWRKTVARPDADGFVRGVAGQTIVGLSRRGKWIIIKLGSGQALLALLRMTGRFVVTPGECVGADHVRVVLRLTDSRSLCFHDVRKFGRLVLVDDAQEVVGTLGPEPLDDSFTISAFRDLLERRRGRIKPLLLDQRFLAGLGNIYTDEALWRATIHPLRPANGLTAVEVSRLWTAIRAVLLGAINSGGTTLDDGGFVGATGEPGHFAGQLAVYGRSEEACPRCGDRIQRIVVGQRGTHICPSCQNVPVTSPESDSAPGA